MALKGLSLFVSACYMMVMEKRKVKHTEKEVKLFLIHKIHVG